MDIITFTKDDEDTEGIAWAAGVVAASKSDLFNHQRVQVTEASDGSNVIATNGAMLLMYECRTDLDPGYYAVLKATKSTVMLHKDCDIDEDGVTSFPDWKEAFRKDVPLWSDDVSGFNALSISYAFSKVIRHLPAKCYLEFGLFHLAIIGPGVVLASIFDDEIGVVDSVELYGGRCRAKIMVVKDEQESTSTDRSEDDILDGDD